jgi:hypothetical protein
MNRGRNTRGSGRGKTLPTTSGGAIKPPSHAPSPILIFFTSDTSRRTQRGRVPKGQTSVKEDSLRRKKSIAGVFVDATIFLANPEIETSITREVESESPDNPITELELPPLESEFIPLWRKNMVEGYGETCLNMGETQCKRNQVEGEEEVTFGFPIIDPTAKFIQMKNISPSTLPHIHGKVSEDLDAFLFEFNI